MSTITLTIDSVTTAGGDKKSPSEWSAIWDVDGSQLGEPTSLPGQAVAGIRDFVRQFESTFGRTNHQGLGVRPMFPVGVLDDLGQRLLETTSDEQQRLALLQAGVAGSQLTIRSQDADALNLPWELLPLGEDASAICCQKDWAIWRAPADGGEFPTAASPAGPLRILFMASAPVDQVALDYDREEDALLSCVATLPGARAYIAEMGSLEELAILLKQVRPQIVHLSGHGKVHDGVGTFAFEDERGHTDSKSAADLVKPLTDSGVQCVFLNACETAQADVAGFCQSLVAAGLPLAIGWSAPVADDLATLFAETFYREILSGEPVPAAMALARLKIQQEGHHTTPAAGDVQDATYILPQLYCAATGEAPPIDVLYDRSLPEEDYRGPETRYEQLPHGVIGLRQGFIGRRREQQALIPAMREGEMTVAVLTGIGGQGKSTLCTRIANRLENAGFRIVAAKAELEGKQDTPQACGARVVQTLLNDLRLALLASGPPIESRRDWYSE